MKPISVLLLEPDLWRYLGILHVLKSEPEIEFVGEIDYNKILTLRRAGKDLKPAVLMLSRTLLMDFSLSLLARMKERYPEANILVHGYEAKLHRIAEILAAGANGYFLLSSPPKELVEAVKVINKGVMWAPLEAVGLMIERARRQKGERLSPGIEELVTPYELTILKFLQQGMTNKEIARKLDVAEVTVKSHLSKTYKRFNVSTRLQLLSYAISHNIIRIESIKERSAS